MEVSLGYTVRPHLKNKSKSSAAGQEGMVLGKFTERVSATEKRGKRIMYFLAFQSVQILERLNSSRCWLRPRPHWI